MLLLIATVAEIDYTCVHVELVIALSVALYALHCQPWKLLLFLVEHLHAAALTTNHYFVLKRLDWIYILFITARHL